MKIKKYVAVGILSGGLFSVLTTANVMAQSLASNSPHELPIKSEFPLNNAMDVKPTTPITITLDPSSSNFARFHQQFIKGDFSVLINDQSVQSTYDDGNHTITIQHSSFSRYTNYTVTLLIKNKAYSLFTFKTGSAIGEATNVTAHETNPFVRVDDGGTLVLTATDDYGNPATNATVTVNGTGNFIMPAPVSITNGNSLVPLKDHTVESTTINYSVRDNTYSDQNDDTNSGTVTETFTPGAPKSLTLTSAQATVKADTTVALNGSVYDQYGNSVSDGTPVNISLSGSTSTTQIVTQSGQFSILVQAPAKAGIYTVKASVNGDAVSKTIKISVTSPTVSFVDPILETAVRSSLGKPTGALTEDDLAKLTSLTARDLNIYDLSGLQYASNLQYLNLTNDKISDISVLRDLTKLQALYLGANPISDISPLSKLTNLQELYAGGYPITDISALSNLKNLTTLSIDNANISDISSLAHLTQLNTLGIGENPILDVSTLGSLTNLQTLSIYNCKLSDISTLGNLTNLTLLYIGNNVPGTSGNYNHITDFTPILKLSNLKYLGVQRLQLTDLSFLFNLKSPCVVFADGNRLDLTSSTIMLEIQKIENSGVDIMYEPNIEN